MNEVIGLVSMAITVLLAIGGALKKYTYFGKGE
jgi:hypothetical protein